MGVSENGCYQPTWSCEIGNQKSQKNSLRTGFAMDCETRNHQPYRFPVGKLKLQPWTSSTLAGFTQLPLSDRDKLFLYWGIIIIIISQLPIRSNDYPQYHILCWQFNVPIENWAFIVSFPSCKMVDLSIGMGHFTSGQITISLNSIVYLYSHHIFIICTTISHYRPLRITTNHYYITTIKPIPLP